jgi:hypothetical protein
MKGTSASDRFVKVTPESVLSFLEEANERIVIAKPGYFQNEIIKILALVKKRVHCNLYVDTCEYSIKWTPGAGQPGGKIAH